MKRCIRIISLVLVLATMMTCGVSAQTVEPRGSSYFTAFDTWLEMEPDFKIYIWFDVVGAGTMDEIGTSRIEIQESTDGVNFTTVDNFYPISFPEMICENTAFHMDYVPFYNTVRGRYYRAKTKFYAKKGNGTGIYYDYTQVIQVPD